MERKESWKVICPRCGEPLEEKMNIMNEKLFICHTEGCDYRFRVKPELRVHPYPDPRLIDRKGI